MITIVLFVVGLCLGSFVNALVFRLREKQRTVKNSELRDQSNQLSIISGRSMCPNCKHQLSAFDLIPILSWLFLRGRCRYCSLPISWQYPVVELTTAGLFVLSYIFWPDSLQKLTTQQGVLFSFWLVFLTGFIALTIYDLKWMLLPDKITYPLLAVAFTQAILLIFVFDGGIGQARDTLFSLLIAGGVFYLLFQLSQGRWIGGGDVKLGALIGIILASPSLSLLMIFTASLLGSIVSIPLLLMGRAKRNTRLPFGPFLIASCIITYLFGVSITTWYKTKFLLF